MRSGFTSKSRADRCLRPAWIVRAALGQVGSGGSIIIAIIAIIIIVIVIVIVIIVIIVIIVSLQKLPADFASRVG